MRSRLLRVARGTWSVVPEGAARNAVRRRLYHVRVGIPRELLINRGDTVVQVGMWRLGSLQRAATSVGPNGRLVLVEASAAAAAEAAQFVRRRGLTQCEVVHAAGWHEAGVLRLQLADDPSGHQVDAVRADLPHGRTDQFEEVVAVTVDDLVRERGISTVDYLEVTVNGAELNVLRGAEATLPHVRRILAAGMMRDADTREPMNRSVAAFLDDRGFRTVISRRGREVDSDWGRIDGHVFASRG